MEHLPPFWPCEPLAHFSMFFADAEQVIKDAGFTVLADEELYKL